jgi:hypothetical protein
LPQPIPSVLYTGGTASGKTAAMTERVSVGRQNGRRKESECVDHIHVSIHLYRSKPVRSAYRRQPSKKWTPDAD